MEAYCSFLTENRNVSRKACPERRRRGAKAAKEETIPNLAFLASWREQILAFECYRSSKHFAQAGKNFNYRNTKRRLMYSLGGSERGVVVRLIADAPYVLGVFEFVVCSDNEDRARQNSVERASGDQHSIALTERGVPVVARGNDFIDVGGAAPALLRKGQIHADADNLHVGQLACFFVESLSL